MSTAGCTVFLAPDRWCWFWEARWDGTLRRGTARSREQAEAHADEALRELQDERRRLTLRAV